MKREYVFEMEKQRSVGLVLQAVYPYLLCEGVAMDKGDGPIKLDITGGTNVQKSPPFEYISQVFAPNLKLLGFPELSIELLERGWTVGSPRLGKVRCLIHPLPSTDGKPDFPPLNLNNYRRGKATKIDITVLAPDTKAWWPSTRPLDPEEVFTLRKYIEHETIVKLRDELNGIPSHIIDEEVPIHIHYSEATYHPTHVYIMIVGHTTTGFRIARDSLLNLEVYFRFKEDKKDPDDYRDHEKILIRNTIENSTYCFRMELYDESVKEGGGLHQPCVDRSMRNQLVILGALGKFYSFQSEDKDESENGKQKPSSTENSRYWSRHTNSARWVCGVVLGVEL